MQKINDIYILSRWVIYNMCDWTEEPIAVSADIELLKSYSCIDAPLIVVDPFHGHYPEDIKCDGVHYTINYIDYL